MTLLRSFAACALLILASCSPVLNTAAPVVNSSGEPMMLKPSRFKVGKDMRKSDVLRLAEDVTRPMGKDFPSKLVRLDPDQGEAVAGALLLLPVDVKEKGRSSLTGVVLPMIAVKSVNIPQERINEAMPSIQRAYYRQLKKHGRLIPMSRLQKSKKP